ncbi:MAG TPA: DUF1223 domain-containing protein [Burkholderiales bacterium]|nr:DUF1223 domain-containing protein [Burkholderiales bacterium]
MHHSKSSPPEEPQASRAAKVPGRCVLVAAILSFLPCLDAGAEPACESRSLPTRVGVLELYTSEGCNSCPPADRWVSALPEKGFDSNRVIPLAFHVDYWDQLGWPDRMAKAQFSERQRMQAHRNRASVVYTPQILLNGTDYRSGSDRTFGAQLGELNKQTATAQLALRQVLAEGKVNVVMDVEVAPATQRDAQAFFVIAENRLETAVRAGENQGKLLRHDFVVRELTGPLPLDAGRLHWQSSKPLHADWKARDLFVAAFVEDARTGDVLQALSAPLCRAR